MPESNLRVCPVCKVTILPGGMAGDKVLFSVGPPGTRATLWARVCQFTQKAGCINQDRTSVGEIKPTDYYQPNP